MRTCRVLGALLALTVPAEAQEPVPLPLADALARAAEHHPAVVAAKWERRGREAEALGSAAAFLPQLSAELAGVRTDDPVAVFGTKLRQGRFGESDFAIDALNFPVAIGDVSTTVAVEQPVFQPEALSGRKAARAAAHAGRLAEERAGQVAAFDVVRAYFGARLAAQRVDVLQESLVAARGTLGQVEKLRREGVVTVVDEQLARSRVSELEAAVAGSRTAHTAASDLLAELLGYQPGTVQFVLTDSLARPEEPPPSPADRPDLAALRAGVRARDAGVLRARSQWLPSVAAFGNLSWHDRDLGLARGPRHWTAGLLVRWVPFRGLAGLGALRRAEAEREGARAQLGAAERRAAAEVRAATAERAAAETAFIAANTALLQATQAARAAASRYDAGAATISELLAVRSAESSHRLASLHALYQARVAAAALLLDLGGTPR